MAPGKCLLAGGRIGWRHECQGRQRDDDGQCSVAASSDIGHWPVLAPAPGCSTWPRPRRWNLGLLLSAKVALFPLIIAAAPAAGGRARAGLMWAETLGPTSPLDHNNAATSMSDGRWGPSPAVGWKNNSHGHRSFLLLSYHASCVIVHGLI